MDGANNGATAVLSTPRRAALAARQELERVLDACPPLVVVWHLAVRREAALAAIATARHVNTSDGAGDKDEECEEGPASSCKHRKGATKAQPNQQWPKEGTCHLRKAPPY